MQTLTFKNISSEDDENNYSLKIHGTQRSFYLLTPKRSSRETGQKQLNKMPSFSSSHPAKFCADSNMFDLIGLKTPNFI